MGIKEKVIGWLKNPMRVKRENQLLINQLRQTLSLKTSLFVSCLICFSHCL